MRTIFMDEFGKLSEPDKMAADIEKWGKDYEKIMEVSNFMIGVDWAKGKDRATTSTATAEAKPDTEGHQAA